MTVCTDFVHGTGVVAPTKPVLGCFNGVFDGSDGPRVAEQNIRSQADLSPALSSLSLYLFATSTQE